MAAYKVKTLVSYFTAVVALAILVLVLYNVKMLSSHQQPMKLYKSPSIDSSEQKVNLKPLDLIPNFRAQSKSFFKKPLITQKKRADIFPSRELVLDGGNCKDFICSELLRGEDIERFEYCEESTREVSILPHTDRCHFIDGRDRDPIALVSFAGSGNTWVRGLLEELTGVCTGAVYCDVSLRGRGFSGEYLRSGSVLVVKTHRHSPIWIDDNLKRPLSESEGRYEAAVFIVRNPFKALVAEWNRKVANNFNTHTVYLDTHVKQVGAEWFGENSRWSDFVQGQARKWFVMISNWIHKNKKHPLILVKYEQLKNNTAYEMHRVLKFLGIELTIKDVQTRIDNGFTIFHRRRNNVTFEHFTMAQKQWVNSAILNASTLFNKLDFREYLVYI